MTASPTVSLAAEPIGTFFGLTITNSIISGWIVTLSLLVCAYFLRRALVSIPGRVQAAVELAYDYFYSSSIQVIGREDVARELFPFVMTQFFFILLSNWSGLLPGLSSIHVQQGVKQVPLFRAPTSDLNTTLALAAITVLYMQYLAIKHTGAKAYFHRFFNFENPILFIVGLAEIISETMRIVSFGFRLFGNIFAGEVLISVIFFLMIAFLPYVAILPLPFFLIELFVGVIQAYIFCFLTIVFTGVAVADHGSTPHSPSLHPTKQPSNHMETV